MDIETIKHGLQIEFMKLLNNSAGKCDTIRKMGLHELSIIIGHAWCKLDNVDLGNEHLISCLSLLNIALNVLENELYVYPKTIKYLEFERMCGILKSYIHDIERNIETKQ